MFQIDKRNYLLFGGFTSPQPSDGRPSPQREGLLPQVESPSLRGEGRPSLGWDGVFRQIVDNSVILKVFSVKLSVNLVLLCVQDT
jgi:hypothetical protein